MFRTSDENRRSPISPIAQAKSHGEPSRCVRSPARSARASRRTCWPGCRATRWIVRCRSRSARTSAGRNPRSGPAHRARPTLRSEFPKTFFEAMCSAINSARTSSLVWIFFSRYSMRSCSAGCRDRPLAWNATDRSRRTPSTNGTRPSAGAPVRHRVWRPAPAPLKSASEWRLSGLPCKAVLAFSCVLSVILTVERSLHFQLRRNTSQ